MKAATLVLLAVISLFSAPHAQASNSSLRSCYQGRGKVLSLHGQTAASAEELDQALMNFCADVSRKGMFDPKYKIVAAIDVASGKFAGGLAGRWASNFSSLDGSALQRRYKSEITRIRKIKNPVERARQAYILSTEHSGEWGSSFESFKSGYLIFSETPENLLNNFEKRKSIGVCREFASLLAWTLSQVANGEFTASAIGGSLPGSGGWQSESIRHEWVRVKMKNGTTFDLDSTWYDEAFTPLVPRRMGQSKAFVENAIAQCQVVGACLGENTP